METSDCGEPDLVGCFLLSMHMNLSLRLLGIVHIQDKHLQNKYTLQNMQDKSSSIIRITDNSKLLYV